MLDYQQTGNHLTSSLLTLIACLGALAFFSGCSTPYKSTLSPNLASQVQDSLTFAQIKASPEDHKGKLVVLGGQVLSAKRLQDSTELIILHLPLVQEREPSTQLTHSQGRYIAYQHEFLDPATVPSGTRVTLTGELTGSVTKELDETDYTYPTLTIKNIKIWPEYASRYPHYLAPYPYWGPYPYAYPFWSPRGRYYGYYPYWYW